MLTSKPAIGTRVRFHPITLRSWLALWQDKTGVIVSNHDAYYAGLSDVVLVRFDELIEGKHLHQCSIDFLELEQLSPEEQDRKRREEHAMKYL